MPNELLHNDHEKQIHSFRTIALNDSMGHNRSCM